MSTRRVAVVSAGLRRPSSTGLLADRVTHAAVAELRERGVEAEVERLELRTVAHEVVDAMLTGFASGPLREHLDFLDGADALIVVTPVHGASFAGLFKSYLDVVETGTLSAMPTILAATGGTARHSLALEYALRPLFAFHRADVVPTAVFAATEDWGDGDAAGALTARIRQAGRELADATDQRGQRARTSPFADSPSFAELIGPVGSDQAPGPAQGAGPQVRLAHPDLQIAGAGEPPAQRRPALDVQE